MQLAIITDFLQIFRRRNTTGRLKRALITAGAFLWLLPLAACAGDQQLPPPVDESASLDGPSVTHGRPDNSQPAIRPKPKPRKKPANPAAPIAIDQGGGGPQGAAEPGMQANAAVSSTPLSAGVSAPGTETADQGAGGLASSGSPNSGQLASLPGNDAGNHPDDMIGRDETGIRALIGTPTKTRTEGSTTVWSYEKEGCSLDLFLFYDVKTGAQRVLSYEIKPNATDSNAVQACYNKFHNV